MQDIPKSIPVKKIIQEAENIKTFVFEYTLNSAPGQFVNLWLPRINEKPMSIAYDDGKEFWVTICAVGEFSKAMHALKEGDLVGVRGPYGTCFTWEKGQHLVMVAGGYGAAPLYNLTTQAAKDGCAIDFIIGAKSKDQLIYTERIHDLENVSLHIATDDGSEGEKGYNVLILEKIIKEAKEGKGFRIKCDGNTCKREEVKVDPIDCVYTCGPEMMMKKVSEMCHAEGLNAQISIERYMKCGFGVCGQCCTDESGERMCKEGPVVNNEKAMKIAEFGKYHRDAEGKIHEF